MQGKPSLAAPDVRYRQENARTAPRPRHPGPGAVARCGRLVLVSAVRTDGSRVVRLCPGNPEAMKYPSR